MTFEPGGVSAGANGKVNNGSNALNGKTIMPSILLVEDNDDFRFYLKENLRLFYKVHEASNGKEGWQKALANHPMLIVSDISMPFMDGIELTEKIKSVQRSGTYLFFVIGPWRNPWPRNPPLPTAIFAIRAL